MAITQNGLIKYRRGKHEKDDRKHITEKKNYVLGWDNKAKISHLKKELQHLQDQQVENRKSISSKETELVMLSQQKDNSHDFISRFEKYEEIDWQSNAQKD